MIARGRSTTKEAVRRGLADVVLLRAEWLDEWEYALLEQVLGHGVRPVEVAMVLGMHRRGIQRRVERLIARLRSPEVEYILRSQHLWERTTAKVAVAVWVKNWGMRRTARYLDLNYFQVRQQVQMVRGILRSAGVKTSLRIRGKESGLVRR